jgi:hypothetical protein
MRPNYWQKQKKNADKLTLENRIYIYAKNHIEVFSKLNKNSDFELNIEKTVDNYLDDFTVEPRINRHIFLGVRVLKTTLIYIYTVSEQIQIN